jgi:hypothetical protein
MGDVSLIFRAEKVLRERGGKERERAIERERSLFSGVYFPVNVQEAGVKTTWVKI